MSYTLIISLLYLTVRNLNLRKSVSAGKRLTKVRSEMWVIAYWNIFNQIHVHFCNMAFRWRINITVSFFRSVFLIFVVLNEPSPKLVACCRLSPLATDSQDSERGNNFTFTRTEHFINMMCSLGEKMTSIIQCSPRSLLLPHAKYNEQKANHTHTCTENWKNIEELQ